MKVTDDLFQLIKSLDQSERRYFKIFASLHIKESENNKYVRLFDAIDSQEQYDESEIRKQFKNEKLLNQLHVAKNYLYNNILKSLRLYHSEKSKLNELMDLLRDVQILYDKSLYKQCRKHLDKAKKIAYEYEKYAQILAIIDWEKTLARTKAYYDFSEDELLNYYNEHNTAMENLSNINEYWKLTMKSFFLKKKQGIIRDKSELEKFNLLIKNSLLESESKAKTFLSKTFYYNIKGLYYHTNNDYKNLLKYCNKLIDLLEANPLLTNQENYIAALNNLLLVQIEMGKFTEAIATINKLRAIETKSVSLQTRIFVTSYDTEINLYLKSGDFEKGIMLVPDIEAGIKNLKEKINKEAVVLFAFNISYLYFGAGDFDNSLKWLNKIINDKELNIREDIQCFARIINILVHYELNNFDLIDYIIKSTKRYLSGKNKLLKFEQTFLSYIKKLINSKNDKDKMYVYEQMLSELSALSKDDSEINLNEYFDFISWLESKIKNKKFQDVVKAKNSKND